MIKLGVNIDHIATLRNARGESHPDVHKSAKIVKSSGADSITIHLREDRRHINDNDLKILSKDKSIILNLEIAATHEMLKKALQFKPNFVCLVPEKRKEITTEGGLNLKNNLKLIKKIIQKLNDKNIRTSLFINPNFSDIKKSKLINTKCIEIHTGRLSRLIKSKKNYKFELERIKRCCLLASKLGLKIHAGHGMDYKTASILKKINLIEEFNIGHFIIGESVFFSLPKVIKKFKKIINE